MTRIVGRARGQRGATEAEGSGAWRGRKKDLPQGRKFEKREIESILALGSMVNDTTHLPQTLEKPSRTMTLLRSEAFLGFVLLFFFKTDPIIVQVPM